MDRLNYFEPYSAPPNHENQLTRAYLVVLRLVPFALSDFLSLVRRDQRAKGYRERLPTLSQAGGGSPRSDSDVKPAVSFEREKALNN